MLDYLNEIKESENELLEIEKGISKGRWRDRIRFIRFLKSGQARTTREAGELVGFGLRQSQRLWRRYKDQGIQSLGTNPYGGRKAQFPKEKEVALKERLKKDDIRTLRDAQRMLKEEFGVEHSISGVWFLFNRLQVKLKTSRPTNACNEEEPNA